jgi:hypothetical protein
MRASAVYHSKVVLIARVGSLHNVPKGAHGNVPIMLFPSAARASLFRADIDLVLSALLSVISSHASLARPTTHVSCPASALLLPQVLSAPARVAPSVEGVVLRHASIRNAFTASAAGMVLVSSNGSRSSSGNDPGLPRRWHTCAKPHTRAVGSSSSSGRIGRWPATGESGLAGQTGVAQDHHRSCWNVPVRHWQ